MTGQTLLFTPGDEVPVDIQDQGNGLPSEGDVVEITGEDGQLTTVGIVNSQGDEGIGVVEDVPSDVDGNAVAGRGTIILAKPVLTLTESTDGALAAGDEVQEDAGGTLIGYDGATTQTSTPLGQVFAANAGKYGFGKQGKVAVALYR
jgi:hypothetical protein